MAKFYLSQPVKIVRDNSGEGPELVGVETFIIGTYGSYWASNQDGFVYPAIGYQLAAPPGLRGYEYLVAQEDELEPILPEGLEAPEQIAELFEPSPEEVTV